MRILSAVLLSVAMSGCVDGLTDDLTGTGENGSGPGKVMSAEEYCASVPNTYSTGNLFYCGTSQANLMVVNFPNGATGYCMFAERGENLMGVGYSVTTYSGGAFPVMSQAHASELSRELGSTSPGYTRCTREY